MIYLLGHKSISRVKQTFIDEIKKVVELKFFFHERNTPSWFSYCIWFRFVFSSRSISTIFAHLSVFLVNIALYKVFSVQMDKFLSAVEKVQIVSKLFAIFSSKSGKIVSSLVLKKRKKKLLYPWNIKRRDTNNTTRRDVGAVKEITRSKILSIAWSTFLNFNLSNDRYDSLYHFVWISISFHWVIRLFENLN